MKRYELTKEQWEHVKAILPPERTGQRGRPRKDDRKMLNGMLWIARSGAQWRELPEVYGPWQSVYARFAKWRDDGTLEVVFRALSADADMENLSLDSTCIKVTKVPMEGEKRRIRENQKISNFFLENTKTISFWFLLDTIMWTILQSELFRSAWCISKTMDYGKLKQHFNLPIKLDFQRLNSCHTLTSVIKL